VARAHRFGAHDAVLLRQHRRVGLAAGLTVVHTFFFPGTDESPSRCTWSIEPRGDATLLTLTHDEFDGETSTYRSVAHGWVPVLSGLKTLLETGKRLEIAYPVQEGVRD
jgi:hypothetical protein